MIRVAHSSSAAKTWFPCRTVFSSAPCRASLAGMLFLLVIVMVSVTVHGEDLPCYTLDPVVVTGSRIPRHLSGTGQSISIITREDIADAPADNIYDLLETVNGLDIRRRGWIGPEADNPQRRDCCTDRSDHYPSHDMLSRGCPGVTSIVHPAILVNLDQFFSTSSRSYWVYAPEAENWPSFFARAWLEA